MKAFGVVDHVLFAGFGSLCLCGVKLLQGREGCLVGEVILACFHGAQPQGAALAGHRGPRDQVRPGVRQRFLLAARSLCLRKRTQEGRHLFFVRVVDIFQGGAGLGEPVAHPVNVSVIQPHGGKDKLPQFHDWCRLSLGRVVHSVGHVHLPFSPFR